MIKDYWIYSDGSGELSWSVYLVKEYEPRKKALHELVFDYTVYSEDIENDTHSHSIVGVTGFTVDEVTNAIIGTIAEHQEVTASDYKKVHDALIDAVLN